MAAYMATQNSTGSPQVTDRDSLVRFLENQGVTLLAPQPVTATSFTQPGLSYSVANDGGELQVFEYRSDAEAEADAHRVGVGMGAHVYQKGQLVALYLGDDALVQTALLRALGRSS